MSSSVHANIKNKDILILGKKETRGLDNAALTAEVECSINFLRSQRKFCLSYHCNGSNSFLLVSATKMHQFKAKDSEIKRYPLNLGNISKDFPVRNLKKTGLNGYVYDFSVDFNGIVLNDILDIHKYLMKKHDIKQYLFTATTFFGYNALKSVSMNNQEGEIKSTIIDCNSNEPLLYLYSIEVNKCSGSCNNINDPYSKLCVPDET